MSTIDRAIAWLVYASVALGFVLLYFANGLVPQWLFLSLAGGVVAYLVCAAAIARKVRGAHYAALVLAVVTLAVSLPRPEHYSFARSGEVAAFAIFSLGSVLQVCIIVAIAARLLRSRARKPPE